MGVIKRTINFILILLMVMVGEVIISPNYSFAQQPTAQSGTGTYSTTSSGYYKTVGFSLMFGGVTTSVSINDPAVTYFKNESSRKYPEGFTVKTGTNNERHAQGSYYVTLSDGTNAWNNYDILINPPNFDKNSLVIGRSLLDNLFSEKKGDSYALIALSNALEAGGTAWVSEIDSGRISGLTHSTMSAGKLWKDGSSNYSAPDRVFSTTKIVDNFSWSSKTAALLKTFYDNQFTFPPIPEVKVLTISPSNINVYGLNSTGGKFTVKADGVDVTSMATWSTDSSTVAWVQDGSDGTARSISSIGTAKITAMYPYNSPIQSTITATITVKPENTPPTGDITISPSFTFKHTDNSQTDFQSGTSKDTTASSGGSIDLDTVYLTEKFDSTFGNWDSSSGWSVISQYTNGTGWRIAQSKSAPHSLLKNLGGNKTNGYFEGDFSFQENNQWHYPFYPTTGNNTSFYAVVAKSDGHFGYHDGTSYKNFPVDLTYSANTWYNIKVYWDGNYGTYKVYINGTDVTNGGIRAKDSAGNAVTSISKITLLNTNSDGTGGMSVDDVVIKLPTSGTYTSDVLNISNNDAGFDTYIGWDEATPGSSSVTVQTSLSTDGGTTWGAWQTAVNGGTIPGITSTINLSNARLKYKVTLTASHIFFTPQLRSINIYVAKGASSTTNKSVTLSITAADEGTGVKQMMISNSSAFTGASWETFAASKAWTLSGTNGSNTVYIKFKDNADNESSVYSDSITFDAYANVTNVSSTTANGSYRSGTVHVTVQFDRNVNVVTTGGTPRLKLETGTTDRYAIYVSGTGTSTLTFDYSIQSGDTSSDLDYVAANSLELNRGTIKDSSGNAAVLTLASPGAAGSLGANKAIIIDTTAPTISLSQSPSTVTNGNVTITPTVTDTGSGVDTSSYKWASGNQAVSYFASSGTAFTSTFSVNSNNTYTVYAEDKAGNAAVRTITVSNIDKTAPTVNSTDPADKSTGVALNKAITVTFSENISAGAGPYDQITAKDSANNAIAITKSISGAVLTINHTANFAANTTYTVTIPVAAVKDSALNDFAAAYTFSFTTLSVNPKVSNVSSTTPNGSYRSGTVHITVQFDKNVNVVTTGGTPRLKLETGATDRYATYVSGTSTSTLTFDYAVQSGDTSSDLDYIATTSLELNGGTIKDSSGNAAVLTLASPSTAGSLGANKAIIIDTTAPTEPTINITSPTGYVTNTWTNQNVKFTVTAGTDSGSGVQKTEYSKDGGTTWATYTTSTQPNPLIEVTLSTEGTTIVKARTVDNAGNTSPMDTATIKIDKTGPTLTISAPSATTTDTNPVTYTVTYTGADIITLSTADITLGKTGTANGNITVSNGVNSLTKTVTIDNITGSGTLKITIGAGTASDLAGNTSGPAGPSTAFTVTGPVELNNVSLDGSRLYSQDVTLGAVGKNIYQASYKIYYTTRTTLPSITNSSTPGTNWNDSGISANFTVTNDSSISNVISGTAFPKSNGWTYITVKVSANSLLPGDTKTLYSRGYSLDEVVADDPETYVTNVAHNQVIGTNVVSSPSSRIFRDGDRLTYRLEFDAAVSQKINDLEADFDLNYYNEKGVEFRIDGIKLQQQVGTSYTLLKNLTISGAKGRYTTTLGNDTGSGLPVIKKYGNGHYVIEYTGILHISPGTNHNTILMENRARLKVNAAVCPYPYTFNPDSANRKFYMDTKVSR